MDAAADCPRESTAECEMYTLFGSARRGELWPCEDRFTMAAPVSSSKVVSNSSHVVGMDPTHRVCFSMPPP